MFDEGALSQGKSIWNPAVRDEMSSKSRKLQVSDWSTALAERGALPLKIYLQYWIISRASLTRLKQE